MVLSQRLPCANHVLARRRYGPYVQGPSVQESTGIEGLEIHYVDIIRAILVA